MLQTELEKERSHTLYRGPTDRERCLMRELSELLAQEEEMERQRSRAVWLKFGDRNTRFFQAKARARWRTNRICALKRADGSEETKQEGLEKMAVHFYQRLFSAQEATEPSLICQFVLQKVTDEMQATLLRPFTVEEIEKALLQMGPCKAPGVDGFTAGFFKNIGLW